MRTLPACCGLFLLLTAIRPGAWAENKDAVFPLHEPIDESKLAATPTARPRVFGGFGRFQPLFQRFCTELRSDGRADKLGELATAAVVTVPDCPACRPFMKTLSTACKRPTAKKSKLMTPTPLQREPKASVLTAASVLSESLAGDSAVSGDTHKAVIRFIEMLQSNDTFTPGERDYYSTLVKYFERPFKAKHQSLEAAEGPHAEALDGAPAAVNLDELF